MVRCVCKRAQNGSVTVIAAKDVRALLKSARIMNESEKSGRQYVLVWRGAGISLARTRKG
jgi:hypothetical protein